MARGIRKWGSRRAVLALGVALSIFAAACSGGSSDEAATDEPVEITYLTHWGPDQVAALEAAAAAFKEQNPNVTVKVQAVPFGNLLSTLRTQAASPTGPTITGIYNLWLPELVRDGIAAAAPAEYADDVAASYPANFAGDVTVDGQVYGYPNEVALYQLNYNKKLFAEAGIANPPATWAELVTGAKALTKKSGGKTTQQGFGVITNWAAGVVHPFLSLAASNGGKFLGDDGTTAVDSPEVVAVADLYKQLLDAGSISPDMSAADANTTGPFLDSFVNGKTAMIIMANWWKGSLEAAMGENFKDIASAPIPVGPNGSGPSGVSYGWLTTVNAKASEAQQAAAWQFLKFLNGPDSAANGSSAMGDILVGMGILPSRTSDAEANAATFADPFLKSYLDALPTASPFPPVIGGQAATEALQKQIEAIIFGKASPADAMKQAKADADAALAQ